MGIREGCRRVLGEEGYDIDLAEDGTVGLRRVQEKAYDLILVDLMMPGIGGLDLIKKIHEIDPEIILVVITGYATIETPVEATQRGAYDYLPKPFTPEALAVLVKRGIEKRELRLEAQRLHDEREQRLLELAGEKSRLRSIIGCMADGVLVTNLQRQLVLWNAAAVKMLRLRDTDEPGRVIRDITNLKEIETIKSQFVSMVAHQLRSPLAAIEGWLGVVLSGEAAGDEEQKRKWLLRAKEGANSLLARVHGLPRV